MDKPKAIPYEEAVAGRIYGFSLRSTSLAGGYVARVSSFTDKNTIKSDTFTTYRETANSKITLNSSTVFSNSYTVYKLPEDLKIAYVLAEDEYFEKYPDQELGPRTERPTNKVPDVERGLTAFPNHGWCQDASGELSEYLAKMTDSHIKDVGGHGLAWNPTSYWSIDTASQKQPFTLKELKPVMIYRDSKSYFIDRDLRIGDVVKIVSNVYGEGSMEKYMGDKVTIYNISEIDGRFKHQGWWFQKEDCILLEEVAEGDNSKFKKGAYITRTKDAKDITPIIARNHVYKQRKDHKYLKVEKDLNGDENGLSTVTPETHNWRFASVEEAAYYDLVGGPFDIETMFKVGDKVFPIVDHVESRYSFKKYQIYTVKSISASGITIDNNAILGIKDLRHEKDLHMFVNTYTFHTFHKGDSVKLLANSPVLTCFTVGHEYTVVKDYTDIKGNDNIELRSETDILQSVQASQVEYLYSTSRPFVSDNTATGFSPSHASNHPTFEVKNLVKATKIKADKPISNPSFDEVEECE